MDMDTTTRGAARSTVAKGTKKTAAAIARCAASETFEVTLNKVPLHLHNPKFILTKVMELFAIVDPKLYEGLAFEVTVKGGGEVARLYAVRQAIAKSMIAYYGKYVDEQVRQDLRNCMLRYDRSLLVADPRRQESKKFGGPGARARYQKSYR